MKLFRNSASKFKDSRISNAGSIPRSVGLASSSKSDAGKQILQLVSIMIGVALLVAVTSV